MQIVQVKISELKAAEYNPRKWSEKATADLTESIKAFGMVDPIIANSAPARNNIVIGGHFRLEVTKDLGYEEVPVVYVDIPDIEKEKELNLRLNKNLGEWDLDLLKSFEETVLANIGFEKDELDEIFGLEVADDFDIEKEASKILEDGGKGVKSGDIWQMGDHKLGIGDATDRKMWEKLLGDERFDFMFTDPPYKLDYASREKLLKKKEGKQGFGYKRTRRYLGVERKGGIPEYDEWLSIAKDFQNPNGANIMVFENWKNTPELWKAIERYWKIRNMIIWWLPNRSQGWGMSYRFFNKYDIAPLAGEGIQNEEYEKELEDYLEEKGQKLLDTYEVIIYGGKSKSYWDRRAGSRWAKASDHITAPAETAKSGGQNIIFGTKPIKILIPYVKILAPRGGVIVEPFAGSGSTIIASEIMKRRCRAIELAPLYGEVILARFENFTGKEAIKLSDGEF